MAGEGKNILLVVHVPLLGLEPKGGPGPEARFFGEKTRGEPNKDPLKKVWVGCAKKSGFDPVQAVKLASGKEVNSEEKKVDTQGRSTTSGSSTYVQLAGYETQLIQLKTSGSSYLGQLTGKHLG